MFPYPEGYLYPRNCWYIAAWRHELGRSLLGRTLLGEPVVMYRREDGTPVALADRCIHRRYPLSLSRLEGDAVQCMYHGFTFDSSGACVRIPSQERVPPTYRLRAYPLAERWEMVWIWMGDPELADPARIPDMSVMHLDTPGWRPAVGGRVTAKARYTFIQDNILDLSHLSYLHHDTVGGMRVASTAPVVEDHADRLSITRDVRGDDIDDLPIAGIVGTRGKVDRRMEAYFFAPSLHVTSSYFRSASEGGTEPGREFGGFQVIHGLTPETPHSTHYFHATTRNFRAQEPEYDGELARMVQMAIAQDEEAAKLCDDMVEIGGLPPEMHQRVDAAALKGRKRVQDLMARERREAATAGPARPAS